MTAVGHVSVITHQIINFQVNSWSDISSFLGLQAAPNAICYTSRRRSPINPINSGKLDN
jgi:hypothetical protein